MIVKIIFLIKSIPRSENNITPWQSYGNKLYIAYTCTEVLKLMGTKKVHFHWYIFMICLVLFTLDKMIKY